MRSQWVFDIETYPNYFLVMFRDVDTDEVRSFELYDDHPLDVDGINALLESSTIIGFNSIHYDLPILSMAIHGATNETLKRVSDSIIVENTRPKELGIEYVSADHIDLIEVAGRYASLKIYGGRLHLPKLQELPISPSALIDEAQRETLRAYCNNDLIVTRALYLELKPQLDLRREMSEMYQIDLRSKSDAQIAESVMRSEIKRLSRRRIDIPVWPTGTRLHYKAPKFIRFNTPKLQNILRIMERTQFLVGDGGHVSTPPEIDDMQLTIGETTYKLGIGGLHSMEKCAAHVTDDEHILVDYDVTSYYPNIILLCGLSPEHLSPHFYEVYRSLVEQRIAAKRAGNKTAADTRKLIINGSFGKFGSKWSALYSPQLLIQTTITGQLSLLMAIEMLEESGIHVVSANTDGILIKCPRAEQDRMKRIIDCWEMLTGFTTEETHYKGFWARDVNSYVATTETGYKAKGVYAKSALGSNPTNEIVKEAVIKYLCDGTEPHDTIHACRDITQFLTLRRVNGGAFDQEGNPLGKAVRWYYSTEMTDTLKNHKGHAVPRSLHAKSVGDLPSEFPSDVRFSWYVNEANDILHAIGALTDADNPEPPMELPVSVAA